MPTRLAPPAALLLCCLFAPGGPARAQQLASPFGSVTQRVDSTVISIEYYRPSVRGRAIFGSLVRWGETWTPGANWATTLEVSRDVVIGGQPLPSGKYSVWMIPGQREWTVTLSRAARRFHVVRPGPADEQLRFAVAADSGAHAEMLTFSFPEVTRTEATLRFQWAGTVIPMRIQVHSTRAVITAAQPLSSYAGVYEFRWVDEPAAAPPIRYEITERGGSLWVRTTGDAVEAGLDHEFDLAPAGGDDFHPRQYKNGVLVGVEADELLMFRIDAGRVTGFEVKGIAEDKVLARAVRVR